MPEGIGTAPQPQMSISLSNKRIEDPNLYRWLLEQKEQFKEEMIRFLSMHEKRKMRDVYNVKSKASKTGWITRSGEIEQYVSVAEAGDLTLMSKSHAIEVSTFLSDFVDPLASTTYYDPQIKINRLAALFGLMAGQMLDNPRYNFKGNETDASAFTLMVCKKMGEVMGRSRGGFLLRELAESTVNYQTQNLTPGDGSRSPLMQMPKKPTMVDNIFNPRQRNNQ